MAIIVRPERTVKTSSTSRAVAFDRQGGDFVVDYARVQGWTKRSRLPPGKSSIFDMRKLFIPINQGNVHWVLVVVDMEGGGVDVGDTRSGEGRFRVTFFDSFGRSGASYVEVRTGSKDLRIPSSNAVSFIR